MKPENEKKYNNRPTKKQRRADKAYLIVLMFVFEALALSLIILPRSTVSENERRELAKFPEFSLESYFSGEYTQKISEWFSDTVPFRDALTEKSAEIRELRGIRSSGIKLHNVSVPSETEEAPEVKPIDTTAPKPAESTPVDVESEPEVPETTSQPQGNHEIDPGEQEEIPADDHTNIKNNGTAVVGTRALMLYGGSFAVGESYAAVINKYKETFGDSVNVYSMIIPTACEFYSPPEVAAYCGSELKNINHVIENLRDDVIAVDVYTPLSQHLKEDIYLRTDHHWAPLGAYYAAQKFAETAGVPFPDLSTYEKKVVKNYVGTMYAYTEDIVIKNNPEDFVYYVPTEASYTTNYHQYTLKDGAISGAYDETGSFFIRYGDGNGMAYCTFMGGDAKVTHVETNAGTGRNLIIFKDSFGNALPAYLFSSFDNIHVVDMRYFTYNAVEYITENGITDILFANNAFHAATASTVKYYDNFLSQASRDF